MFKDFLSVVEMEDREKEKARQENAVKVISEKKSGLLFTISENFPGLLNGVKDPVVFYLDAGECGGTATGEVGLLVEDAPAPFVLYYYRASDSWRWGAAIFFEQNVSGKILKISESFSIVDGRGVRKWLAAVVSAMTEEQTGEE